MKKGLFIVLFIVIANLIYAQSLDRALVSTGGGSYANGSLQADVSIGEPVIGTFEGDDYMLTQGFQQGLMVFTEIENLQEIEFQLYPNPAVDYVTFEFPVNDFQDVTLQVISVNGQVIWESQLTETSSEIQVSSWPAGIYMLRIFADDELQVTSKISKQ
ncbi:MAG: T9SS type A sorting domain-containing protein [Bacteroidales bacterium]|jgi:hypothetical protein|nr:T9SS type A sorting domain-containing protein [Bacteroidales bacterium]